MNKLVLIGNGFDLAHGLPTSYTHFLNDFWKKFKTDFNTEVYKELVFFDEKYNRILNYNKEIKSFKEFEENMISYQNDYSNEIQGYKNFQLITLQNKVVFKFCNTFFKTINSKNNIENWVDIENEYYYQLKKITGLKFGHLKGNELAVEKKKKVIILNKEFKQIKNLLENYLQKQVVKNYSFNSFENPKGYFEISEILKPIILKKEPYVREKIKKLSKEFSYKDDKIIFETYENRLAEKEDNTPIIHKSLLLSFNYTPTIFSYNYFINNDFGLDICATNYIHGEIKSIKNKINFGFGDEIDSAYSDIENIGDNEYLMNFKSFYYLDTQNYNNLLGYIDSGKYQVYVLGHSCGLSDRVLLNTIFEHKNCRSIKVFYHDKVENDNYTDIIQNISRHFKDKQSMRRKIVSKELCSPLPQNISFKRK